MFEQDSVTNYVCRMCFSRIDLLSKLVMKFRTNNVKTLQNLKNIPGNEIYIKQREIFQTLNVSEVIVYLM